MAVTLTANSITFTFNQGDISKISSKLTPNLDPMPLPLSGPTGVLIYDMEGVMKQITVVGALTSTSSTRISGYTITSILQQKQWIESLVNGVQSIITFVSNYEEESVSFAKVSPDPYLATFGSTTVKISSLTFDEEEANPDMLPFTLVLEVGTG